MSGLKPTKVVGDKNITDVEIINQESSILNLNKNVNNEIINVNDSTYLENIPEHLRSKVLSLKNNIDINKPESIEEFGKDIQNSSASDVMSEIKVGESGQIGEQINTLLKTTKSLDPSDLIDKKPGMISKLFGMVKEPIVEFKNKQKTVEEAVNQIAEGLKSDANKLLERNRELNTKYEKNKLNVEEFNVVVAAGRIRCHEIETKLLPELKTKAEQSQKEEDSYAYTEAKNFLTRLESRVSRLDMARATSVRRAPVIRNMQDSNAKEAEVINDLISIAIPVWRDEMELHIMQLETKRAMENEKAVTNVINETMQRNAELMRENAIEIAKNSNGTLITIDTIRTVQTNLIQTITEVENINKQGKIDRENQAKELVKLDSELKQALIK